MKKILVLLAVLSMALGGCSLISNPPTLSVAVDPPAGHPPFDITITATCSEDGGVYVLEEDGKDPVESTEGVFKSRVTTWPYIARVVWRKGEKTVSEPVKVSLVNRRPVAHGLWTSEPYHYHALIRFDLRYLERGCESTTGKPDFYTGIEDPDYTADGYSPDNDGFEYRIEVKDVDTGKYESVFYGPDRELLRPGQYISSPIFYWFVGWDGNEPLMPYRVWSPQCGPPAQEMTKEVHVYVKEFGSAYHWVYTITATP